MRLCAYSADESDLSVGACLDKKQPRQGGTIAVESERIAWGEMDAPYRENATDPKRLHVDERFFCTRFGSGESPLPAPSGSRGGNVAPVPPF